MEYGLIGAKLGHSYSPEIYKEMVGFNYTLNEIKEEDIKAFLDKRDFKGINVTIPYKQTVLPYVDYIDDAVKAIGACNTIVNRDGKLCVYNTDAPGFEALVLRSGIQIKDKKVAILGAGGASKPAQYILKKLGAKEILVTDMRDVPGCIKNEELPEDIDVLVNTTPCGMYPKNDTIAIDIDRFPNLEGVIDIVYNPLKTPLVLEAEKRGIKAEAGLYMLVAQAYHAAQIYLGKELDYSLIEKTYQHLRNDKKNIVLIGMPTSGKTSVGKELAKSFNKQFVDIDEEIVKKIGMEISEFFKLNGEKAFRDIEEEVVSEVAKHPSQIIATGGGSILREKNVDHLRQNGTLYFLDRPLEKLITTSSRPLSSDREALKKRYEERYGIYSSVADIKIDASGTIEDSVKAILEKEGK
ncbi:MAG: shikimate dehydrogenase [Bacilli bacterium]|nr:shikimate dehydrogenase [Bacilli bacterium]